MPFKFSQLCELFEELQQQKYKHRVTYSKQDSSDHRILTAWYNKYADEISRVGPSAVAFLSALLPERRPDRTYNLQEKRLSQIFARVLGVGASRVRQLQSWQEVGGLDFPTCVERVMSESECDPPTSGDEVTLEQIDFALTQIAANTIASAPAIKTRRNDQAPSDILAPIVRRLRSTEAKWLTRMILKSYSPVEIPEYEALHQFHFMLPKLLGIQNSIEAAVETLAQPSIAPLPPQPSKDYQAALLPIIIKEITPQLGIMIRRQTLDKARSIKHCVKMAGSRIMSVERKYDGEYCQIHIDLSNHLDCIQIFSKSGRDSTRDRLALQFAIRAGLNIGRPECKIRERAILEGELLVYSTIKKDILPFYHIRKHVYHGGRRIGTEADSPKKCGEDLMIAFFDVLMLDDKIMISESHNIRRAHLKAIVIPIEGTSKLVERQLIDFKSSKAPHVLREVFGIAIRKRWEGFVLKGLDDPYFSWKEGTRAIKLKKDYIAGLGDPADLCIVGGHRNPRDEIALHLGRLSWTSFYVACLLNKEDVRRYDSRPSFKIVDSLGIGNLSKQDILALNAEGKLVEQKFAPDSEFMAISHTRKDLPVPSDMFTKPMIVEIMGAGYERPQTVDFYTLRFPRRVGVRIKIHKDRGVAETTSFEELQQLAQKSMQEDAETASEEDAAWIERLLAADPASKHILDKSQSTSPAKTLRSETTVSLTPAGARKASTQQSPLLVRMDSDEMTPNEYQHRYPSSAPQTPSRRSDLTFSPASTTRVAALKRGCNAGEETPTPSPIRKRKRKHVEFRSSVEVRENTSGLALSDITDSSVNTRNARSLRTYSQKLNPVALSSMVPNKQPETTLAAITTKRQATAEILAPPPSTANAAEIHKEPLEAQVLSDGCATPRPVQAHMIASTPVFQNPSEIGTTGGLGYKPASSILGPIYVTPSLAKHEHIIQYLQSASAAFTFSSRIFVHSLSSSPPQQNRMILVHSLQAEDTISDIQRLCRLYGASRNRTSAGIVPVTANILIFDFDVLGTEFGKSGFGKVAAGSEMLDECERYFCGVLEALEDIQHGRRCGLRPRWDVSLSEALFGRAAM